MGFLDAAKKSLAANVDIKAWLGAGILKQSTAAVYDIYKDLKPTAPSKSDPLQAPENFEEVMAKNGISEEDLAKRMRNAFTAFCIYLLCLIVVFAYSLSLLTRGYYEASIFGWVLVVVFLSFTFREHFNYFQMKERRLGCTFKEWFKAVMRGNIK